jgi:uncharacterized membrane protein YphA (DoxX/SURF4 family)
MPFFKNDWIMFGCRWLAAGILLQTLFFKFTGAPESRFIFSQLGAEPWGRWVSGVCELLTSILLILPFPTSQTLGALFGMCIMAGAIFSHVLFLGLEIQNDKGLLFGLACTVFILCLLIVWAHQDLLKAYIITLLNKHKKP